MNTTWECVCVCLLRGGGALRFEWVATAKQSLGAEVTNAKI